ncbi:MAG: hypothetical protein J6X07_08935 [Prevotella sp.]|nr:hypothetical protein [Prevotella sp.]
MTTKKLDIKDLVMFPRTQQKGLEPQAVKRGKFSPICRDVETMGKVWSLRQEAWPHVEVQIIETNDTAHFDRLFGTALGMKRWAEYIEGRTDFFVMQMGTQECIDWKQHDPHEVMTELHETIREAARWWHQYGDEVRKDT